MNSRNNGIDILKFICCFMVICIHAPLQGIVWSYWDALCKISVPCFFMITGYFYCNTKKTKNQKKQMKKIFNLILGSNLLYFFWNIIIQIQKHNLYSYLNTFSTPWSIINKKVMSGALISGHLWYLFALLIVFVIVFIADKFNILCKLYYVIPVLYLCGVFLGKYSFIFNQKNIPIVFSRNFLFTGLTFFLIGNMLDKFQYSRIVISIKRHKYILLLSSVILLFLENSILNMYGSGKGDMFFFNGFVAVMFFVVMMDYNIDRKNVFLEIMTRIGRYDSAYIYIFHYMIINILNMIINKLFVNDIGKTCACYFLPLGVFVISCVVSIVWNRLINRFKTKQA